MTKLLFSVFFLLSCSNVAFADQQAPEDPKVDRKIVEMKHLRGNRLVLATQLVDNFIRPGKALQYADLNAIMIEGTPANIAAAEMLLKRFDVPSGSTEPTQSRQSYQLRVHLIEASPNDGNGGTLPVEVASAVEQMRKTFQYKSYSLLDIVIVQMQLGSGTVLNGILPGESQAGYKSIYEARVKDISQDDTKALFLRGFYFRIGVPMRISNGMYTNASVETNLTIRPGQKLVVGKLSKDESSSAIFLIITAEPI
ncbi:MAG: hypothetical protein H7039_23225 [Bryobacteraceae bacterium]|nr:hypothetical protein [Bryobacteraceae bacterium]